MCGSQMATDSSSDVKEQNPVAATTGGGGGEGDLAVDQGKKDGENKKDGDEDMEVRYNAFA